jgi:hypothetical protein
LKIKEPIFVLLHDSKEINKYRYLKNAEIDLEAYDIDNYSAFDSNFNKLKLYKKDKFNRVGFKLLDSKINKQEIQSYLTVVPDEKFSIDEILYNLKSYEEYNISAKYNKVVMYIVVLLIVLVAIGALWLL